MSSPDWYLEKRRLIEERFREREEVAYTPGLPEESLRSPSGRFRLILTQGRDRDQKYWGYSRGRVFEGDRLIADVRRNYSAFPFAWVEPHPDNHQAYLICGEDYQGQTVIHCETGRRWDWIDPGAEQGVGFCWAAIHPHPTIPSLLAVEGCYWACPYEVRFVRLLTDGRLEELARVEGNADFGGWVDGGARVRIKSEVDIVKSTSKPVRELTGAEEAAHDALFERYKALTDEQRKHLTSADYEDLLDETTVNVEEDWNVEEKLGIKIA